jgi:membrane protein DedA with SNARE-associated domain
MGIYEQLPHLVQTYGYWLIAGIVLLESMGIPLPGEAVLITASVYAGTTHGLDIGLVIGATIAGAVVGDNIGYAVGDKLGYRLLLRHGARIGLTERKIKLGQYLFQQHGGKVVFLGRFVAVLRVLAAFLAGVNRMPWTRFFAANLAGAVLWATAFGLGAYTLGEGIHRITGPVGAVLVVLAAGAILLAGATLRRHETELEERAVRAIPGPLERP